MAAPEQIGDGFRDERPRGETQMTSELITAASKASQPLSQDEIDKILGLRGGDDRT